MIVIINGAIGVGKSSVSWELLDLFERAVMLDGDYFAAIKPFSIFDLADLQYSYEAIAHQVAFHYDRGLRNFVINYVFETPKQLAEFALVLERYNLMIQSFYLQCEQELREARIRKRGNDDVDWEIKRSLELTRIMQEAVSKGELGLAIDTSNKTAKEVALEIFGTLQLQN